MNEIIASMMDPGMGVKFDGEAPQESRFVQTVKTFTDNMQGMHTADNKSPTVKNVNFNDIKEVEEQEEEKKFSSFEWSSTPTYSDQFTRFPNLCRTVGPQMAIFNVTEKDQLLELNTFLQKQQPDTAPSIILINKKENFHEGKWLVLLEYYRVEYKRTLTTS